MRTPALHPGATHLEAYVSGQAAAPVRRVVEAHLLACETCRTQVEARAVPEVPAAPAGLPPADPALLAGIRARLRAPNPAPSDLPFGPELLRLLPLAGRLPWRSALRPGIRVAVLAEDAASRSTLYLVHLKPGRPFPLHHHEGGECSVILQGGLRDGEVEAHAGDFQETGVGTQHGPVALEGEDCWVLACAEEGSVRFEGWRGLLQLV
jgi:putative transcriptional regulator